MTLSCRNNLEDIFFFYKAIISFGKSVKLKKDKARVLDFGVRIFSRSNERSTKTVKENYIHDVERLIVIIVQSAVVI